MRITHKLLYSQVQSQVQRAQQDLFRTQESLVTEKRVNRPSDDPMGASRLVELRKLENRIGQFGRNIDQAQSFLDATELALGTVNDNLTRTKEIMIAQLNGTQDQQGRDAAIAELNEIRATVVASMNSKSDGRYVFSGYQTRQPAFDDTGAFTGIAGQSIEVEISEGQYVAMNLTGDPAFVDPDTGRTTIEFIDQTIAAITAADETALGDLLPEADAHRDRVLSSLAEVGGRTSRLGRVSSDNEDLKLAATTLKSNIEDLDIAEATVQYAEQERILQATLDSSSRMLSLSILDFLR